MFIICIFFFFIVDIDECVINVDICVDFSSMCVNIFGVFWCDCKIGFNKFSDFICVGKIEMLDYYIVLIENIKVWFFLINILFNNKIEIVS